MLTIEKIYSGFSKQRAYRHVAYWCFWLLLYASVNSTNSTAGFGWWVRLELTVMLIKLPYVYFMIYFLVPRFLIKRRYYPFFAGALLATVAGGLAVWSLHYFYFYNFLHAVRTETFFSSALFYKSLDLVYVSAFPVIVKLQQFYQQQEKRNREVVEEKLNAELELLKNQLQPHFLFNTLNNLYGMILSGHEKSGDVVLQLSNMMSYMLYECDTSAIALEKEIAHLKNYMALEKIRYGSRLQVSFEYGGDMAGKKIAPLLLFGFIENAFKHVADGSGNEAWIRINLWVKNEELDFLCENSFSNAPAAGEAIATRGGIGLTNIQKRLELLYPRRYDFKIEQKETWLVHLKLTL
jgi:two-component system, LytTR family, sensor kinase